MPHVDGSNAPRHRRLLWLCAFVVAGCASAFPGNGPAIGSPASTPDPATEAVDVPARPADTSPQAATGDSAAAPTCNLAIGNRATALPDLGFGTERPRLSLADTIEIVARRPGLSFQPPAGSAFLSSPSLLAPRPVPVEVLLRPRTTRISRFACALYGADRGAGTAAALSGLGLVTGALDGRKAGYLMGAGAVLGALWGSTAGAEDPRFRVRIEAEPVRDGERQERIDPDQIRSSRRD